VPVNQGVIASFWLVLENSGSWCFLQVGACKSRGLVPPSSWCWRIWKLVLPMNVFLIYIRKHFVVFSHLGFHVNSGVLCMWLFDVMILLMVIYS
jgi:hypothetical protein